jgi:hypothetical protein
MTNLEYLAYNIWEHFNQGWLIEKYIGKKYKEESNIIIFHGHCLDCVTQHFSPVLSCMRCSSFRAGSKGPDLKTPLFRYELQSGKKYHPLIKEYNPNE